MNFEKVFKGWIDRDIPFESVDPEAKWHQIIRYATRYVNLVETGTAQGVTTEVLAKFYKRVWTIELARDYYDAAQVRLGQYPHVKQILGSSATCLQDVVDEVAGPAVYFLDGHYSGPGTGQDFDIDTPDIPIMKELEILAKEKWPNVIIIDDARLFKGQEHYDKLGKLLGRSPEHPSFEDLQEVVKSLPTESYIYRELDSFIIEPLKPRPERADIHASFVPRTTKVQGS